MIQGLINSLKRRLDEMEKRAKKDLFGRLWDGLLGWFFRRFNATFTAAANGYVAVSGRMLRSSARIGPPSSWNTPSVSPRWSNR